MRLDQLTDTLFQVKCHLMYSKCLSLSQTIGSFRKTSSDGSKNFTILKCLRFFKVSRNYFN